MPIWAVGVTDCAKNETGCAGAAGVGVTMVDNSLNDAHAPQPPDLVEQVADASEHLYDLEHLERHPLAQHSEFRAGRSVENAGHRLRSELVQAIESLSPGPAVSFQSPQARVHNLLVLHYVECRTVQEAAHMADISRRQAHRDLRQGVERVAAIFWARRCSAAAMEPGAALLSSVESEVARLEHHPGPTDIRQLLDQARETVRRLAVQREIRFQLALPRHPVVVSADSSLAQQVLVNLLSHAVQQAQAGALHVKMAVEETRATISVRYHPEPGTTSAMPVNTVIAQMVDRLGWTVENKERADGSRVVTLHMTKYGPRVLVVDDNEGLVKMLGRYLTDQACQVIAATDGQEGLRLAQEQRPDVIVLDVMVPHIHGWEVLQRLRNHPETADIPVIICSVINDPGLAFSLGASLFLPKPVRRDQILEALRQLAVL
jgi:CheY-like chemotaxis protein